MSCDKGAAGICVSTSSDEDSDYCYTVKSGHFIGEICEIDKKTPKANIAINKVKCSMLIDTGASVNILDEQTYQKIGSPKLQKKNLPPLYPYGGTKSLDIKGYCELVMETSNKIDTHKFYIIKGTMVL